MVTAESPASRVGHITLDRKRAGKPIAGNRHDGFEVAGTGNQLTGWLVRHSRRKRGATDRPNLRSPAPVLDPTSGKWDRSAFFRMFQAVATEAGMPPEKRHPHCLKHSLGFAMVEANRSLTTSQNALGHRSVASTGIYAQPSREQVDHAIQ